MNEPGKADRAAQPAKAVPLAEPVRKALIWWAAVFVAISVAVAAVYGAVQQELRHSANSPQVQLAYDAAFALEDGQTPDQVVPQDKVDIGRSLAPFVIIYDANKTAVASSATLDGTAPSLPAGVFDSAARHGESRVTWMPNATTRIAAVVVPVGGSHPGFVVAGRSLRESERTIGRIGVLLLLGWAAASFGTLVLALGWAFFLGRKTG